VPGVLVRHALVEEERAEGLRLERHLELGRRLVEAPLQVEGLPLLHVVAGDGQRIALALRARRAWGEPQRDDPHPSKDEKSRLTHTARAYAERTRPARAKRSRPPQECS
jgi:hypothetical protein